jgi:L-malate glycosyltransferase
MDNKLNFKKNKRIAFICFSSALGGLELSIFRLASEFKKRSAECFIIIQPDTKLARYAEHLGYNIIPIKVHLKYGDLAASAQLAHILRTQHIDIAVLMQSKDFSVAAAAHFFAPSVRLVFYQSMQSGISKRDIIHTIMYSRLSLWISLTEKMKRDVINHTRVPKEKIVALPIGTDMTRFDPDKYNAAAARKKLGLPKSKLIIGCLGRLDPQKGQEEFVRAIPILLRNHKNIHFVIAGEETHEKQLFAKHLQEIIRSQNISASIQFLPFTDEVPEFMSALDIFVLPSYSETFGYVLVEAMAMKKAIVATDSGGVPEIITNDKTGLLIPPRDVTALAEALDKLIKNSKLRNSLSSQAYKDSRNRFDINICIDELVHLLDSL